MKIKENYFKTNSNILKIFFTVLFTNGTYLVEIHVTG